MTRPSRFPEEFIRLMSNILPDRDSLDAFLAASQRPLRRSLRVNTLKISVKDFLARTADYPWTLTPIPWCAEGFWIDRQQSDEDLPLGSVAEHLSGLFYIQEASSMLPVSALFDAVPHPGQVLDIAAAPGSKTTQMAALMANQGTILANEYAASRVKTLHASLSRCGVTNTAITHFDGRVFGAALPESFDAVLLDAPCSGEGVIRKDALALRNWSPESVDTIAAVQRERIDQAFHALKPGGTLVYSTCTLNATENQQVIAWLKQRYPDAVTVDSLQGLFSGAEKALTPEGYLHLFPHIFDCEGFFVARLRKTASLPPLPAPAYKISQFPFTPLSSRQTQEVQQAAADVGLHWQNHLSVWQRENELWLFTQAIETLSGRIRFSRPGLRLAERFNRGLRWQYEAVIALTCPAAENQLELTPDEARAWYRGQDIWPQQEIPANEVIVTFQQQPLGLAKKVGQRLKNSYPRELVRDGKLFEK